MVHFFIKYLFYCLLFCIPFNIWADTPVFMIKIQNHLFIPSEIIIPENTKVKLVIDNVDDTDEEFESHDLNREKVIIARRKGIIFIGPLAPGEYPFEGEFFPKTAQGKIIVMSAE